MVVIVKGINRRSQKNYLFNTHGYSQKLSFPLIAAKFIHTEKILKTMQIQFNSIHSLYSSKTCRYFHAKNVTLRKKN